VLTRTDLASLSSFISRSEVKALNLKSYPLVEFERFITYNTGNAIHKAEAKIWLYFSRLRGSRVTRVVCFVVPSSELGIVIGKDWDKVKDGIEMIIPPNQPSYAVDAPPPSLIGQSLLPPVSTFPDL